MSARRRHRAQSQKKVGTTGAQQDTQPTPRQKLLGFLHSLRIEVDKLNQLKFVEALVRHAPVRTYGEKKVGGERKAGSMSVQLGWVYVKTLCEL